ncbi:hypothetical protein MLD38_025171 [Melastoma candidum]|uniref:Uncharacterized protein n=1 Tax=Melastoma candidum TaxID=119954 RepID=A0ACB9NZP3_9MYRT|nr:hypothetical protein MLD38_025171 [Melastoma candidum]
MSRIYAFNLLYALLVLGSLAYVSLNISDESKNRLEVGFYLVKLVPKAIIGISGFVGRIIFSLTADSLFLVTKLIQTSAQALKEGLQLLAESIRSFILYLLQLFWNLTSTLVSAVLDIVKEAVSNSVEAFAEAKSGMGEKVKEGVEALKEAIKENADSMVEMATQAVSDLWSNFQEAQSNDKEEGE